MKPTLLPAVAALLLFAGCFSVRTMSDREDVNWSFRGGTAIVGLHDGTTLRGRKLHMGADSTCVIDYNTDVKRCVANADIASLARRSRAEGAAKGFVVGAAAGAATGTLIGILAGGLGGGEMVGLALAVGFVLGTGVGSVCGITIGAIVGHTTSYELLPDTTRQSAPLH